MKLLGNICIGVFVLWPLWAFLFCLMLLAWGDWVARTGEPVGNIYGALLVIVGLLTVIPAVLFVIADVANIIYTDNWRG